MNLFWEDKVREKKSAEKKERQGKVKLIPPSLCNPAWPSFKEYKSTTLPPDKNNLQAILDIECYPNYFLVKFKRLSDNKMVSFEKFNDSFLDIDKIKEVLKKYEIITFNGANYDIPILRLALADASNETLKIATDRIITQNIRAHQLESEFTFDTLTKINTIDLAEVAPGVRIALKLYAGRLHCRNLQSLPYPPETILTKEEATNVDTYCGYDLDDTHDLFMKLAGQISLRRIMSTQYKIDLRSKSDAQIAEEIIKSEITQLTKHKIPKTRIRKDDFLYTCPEFVKFTTKQLQDALEIVTTRPFTMDKDGRPNMPKELITLKVSIGTSVYQMGMGGLHSTESRVCHVADKNFILVDSDVSSYYPEIILKCGLYPKQLGKPFLDVYQTIVTERLTAKYNGDKVKADSLKITINGSFGKLGSPYSVLYSPELMIQVTVTGQLSLLMLIEMLEEQGIPVVSGNTDGIVIKCPAAKEAGMKSIIAEWEERTGFTMEQNMYAGLFSRDINNYIAVKENGTVKTKGCFSVGSLSKNPQNEICNIAMINYILNDTPFEETIMNCKDITKFLTVRTVKGGAMYKKEYQGKVVRWYYAKGSKDTINYKTTQNQVARSYGSKPLAHITDEFPSDIDYQWYIDECENLF